MKFIKTVTDTVMATGDELYYDICTSKYIRNIRFDCMKNINFCDICDTSTHSYTPLNLFTKSTLNILRKEFNIGGNIAPFYETVNSFLKPGCYEILMILDCEDKNITIQYDLYEKDDDNIKDTVKKINYTKTVQVFSKKKENNKITIDCFNSDNFPESVLYKIIIESKSKLKTIYDLYTKDGKTHKLVLDYVLGTCYMYKIVNSSGLVTKINNTMNHIKVRIDDEKSYLGSWGLAEIAF